MGPNFIQTTSRQGEVLTQRVCIHACVICHRSCLSQMCLKMEVKYARLGFLLVSWNVPGFAFTLY